MLELCIHSIIKFIYIGGTVLIIRIKNKNDIKINRKIGDNK